MQYKLSILIPANNEMFLKDTVENILKNKREDTEIIVGLDGKWANPPLVQHPDVNIIYVPKSIGQRAITKMCGRLSKAKFIMKLDAHCTVDEGFDVKMLEAFEKVGDDVTMVPTMRNLWMFDWKCMKCGKKWYQGPTPTECKETNFRKTGNPCDSKKFKRKMMLVAKKRPQSNSYCFDSGPHFQYFNEYTKRPEYKKMLEETGLTETMSLQGSCFMMTREKYFSLDIDDENLGSWGNQGLTVACKTWLTGGRVLVNHSTYYAHMFRTQGGDFGFPYEQKGRDVARCKAKVRNILWKNKILNQKYPLSWLIERFMPIDGWTKEEIEKLKNNFK